MSRAGKRSGIPMTNEEYDRLVEALGNLENHMEDTLGTSSMIRRGKHYDDEQSINATRGIIRDLREQASKLEAAIQEPPTLRAMVESLVTTADNTFGLYTKAVCFAFIMDSLRNNIARRMKARDGGARSEAEYHEAAAAQMTKALN